VEYLPAAARIFEGISVFIMRLVSNRNKMAINGWFLGLKGTQLTAFELQTCNNNLYIHPLIS
jgi:hypothetical protein